MDEKQYKISFVEDSTKKVTYVYETTMDRFSFEPYRIVFHDTPWGTKWKEGLPNYEQSEPMRKLIDSLSERNTCGSDIKLVVDEYDRPIQFKMYIDPNYSFIRETTNQLVNPKFGIEGEFSAINLDCKQKFARDLGYHKFSAFVNLDQEQKTRIDFKGMHTLTELCLKSEQSKQTLELKFSYSVILTWKAFKLKLPLKKDKVNVMEKLLSDNLFSDCYIIAANKAEVSCHRGVLAAQSDVLQTMLTSGLVETQTHKIEMSDVSEPGVKAFVNYLYRNKLTDEENIEDRVALELLEMGHKYDIPDLEEIMLNMLHKKPENWFSLNVVLTIYHFALKIDNYQQLANKMKAMLKRNAPELLSPEACQEFLERQSKCATGLESQGKYSINVKSVGVQTNECES